MLPSGETTTGMVKTLKKELLAKVTWKDGLGKSQG
jgi:hypothetical protein